MTKHIAFAALFALGATAAVAGQDGQTPQAVQPEPAGTFLKFEQLPPSGMSDRGMLLNQMAASAFEQKESLGLSDRTMLLQGPVGAPPTGLSDRTFLLAPGTPIAAAAGADRMDTAKPEEPKPQQGAAPRSSVN